MNKPIYARYKEALERIAATSNDPAAVYIAKSVLPVPRPKKIWHCVVCNETINKLDRYNNSKFCSDDCAYIAREKVYEAARIRQLKRIKFVEKLRAEGRTYKQIAGILDISITTLSSLRIRAERRGLINEC